MVIRINTYIQRENLLHQYGSEGAQSTGATLELQTVVLDISNRNTIIIITCLTFNAVKSIHVRPIIKNTTYYKQTNYNTFSQSRYI